MSKIIGAIATSHTPTIGFAQDASKQQDPAWMPIFEAYAPVKAWLAEKKPDVLLVIYNDHVTSFFFDHYSPFALGIGESYLAADEGGGARRLPPVPGHSAMARHIGQCMMANDFDLSFFQHKPLDHGVLSPLSVIWPYDAGWPGAIVPLQVGVLQFPIPSARRCYKFGQELRLAIESYPAELRVALVATGGLSHQVHGERAGFNNTAWDNEFLDRFEHDPESLLDVTHAQFAERGGFESAEVVMWLVMRGALGQHLRCVHRAYCLPSMTGIATAIYEEDADTATALVDPAGYMENVNHQVAGLEHLPGTYPFTLEVSVRAYRINAFLHRLIEPPFRKAFLAEPQACFEEADLTPTERALISQRDWIGMIRYGVIFFLLEKLGAVIGISNLHIYSAMRGEPLETFMKSRNAPGALYSVAGDTHAVEELGKQKDLHE
jgi:gallate dioxygenase